MKRSIVEFYLRAALSLRRAAPAVPQTGARERWFEAEPALSCCSVKAALAARYAVGHALDELKTRVAEPARVLEHLEAVRNDLLANVGVFIVQAARREAGDESEALFAGALERYSINVLVSQPRDAKGAPMIPAAMLDRSDQACAGA
jgi:hypothetical protein